MHIDMTITSGKGKVPAPRSRVSARSKGNEMIACYAATGKAQSDRVPVSGRARVIGSTSDGSLEMVPDPEAKARQPLLPPHPRRPAHCARSADPAASLPGISAAGECIRERFLTYILISAVQTSAIRPSRTSSPSVRIFQELRLRLIVRHRAPQRFDYGIGDDIASDVDGLASDLQGLHRGRRRHG